MLILAYNVQNNTFKYLRTLLPYFRVVDSGNPTPWFASFVSLHRLLAHTLVEALWDQLLLDVSGGGGVFTMGDTSRLIGTTVAAAVGGILYIRVVQPMGRQPRAAWKPGSGVGL